MTVNNIEVMSRNGSLALRNPDHVDARVLAANTAEAHAVPANAAYVIFSADADFYVRYNAALAGTAAAVPSTDVTDGTACELNPTIRYIGVDQVAEISIISPLACIVTMAFYGA